MKYILLLTLFILATSCNKEKRASEKLMKGETWLISEISVAGTNQEIYGTWNITDDINIYDTVPTALWKNGNEDAVFEWQFHEKAKEFIISYKCLCEENESSLLDNLDYTVHDLTGTYDVEKRSAKKMIFKSKATLGFTGKEVVITINQKEIQKF